MLAVNSKNPPLNNPLVKQAMSLAIDREAIVKELWRGRGIVPSGPIAKGDNHFDASLPPLAYDPKEARERLKKAGYKNEPVYIETTVGYTANDKPMSEAIAGMWKDVGLNAVVEVVEFSVRAQKNREKSFKGLWWSDPTSTLGDPDGMMWRLLGPGGPQDYWRHPEFDELGNAARFTLDEKFRGEAYKKMTRIFLEHNPWIVVIQPYEDYGLQQVRRVHAEPEPAVRDPALQLPDEARLASITRPAVRAVPRRPLPAALGRRLRGFGGFLAYRLFRTLIALWLVSTVVFVVMRLSGDPVPLLLPPDAPIAEMERVRRDLGLDRPLAVQYGVYLGNVLRGDFGRSIHFRQPAMERGALLPARRPSSWG